MPRSFHPQELYSGSEVSNRLNTQGARQTERSITPDSVKKHETEMDNASPAIQSPQKHYRKAGQVDNAVRPGRNPRSGEEPARATRGRGERPFTLPEQQGHAPATANVIPFLVAEIRLKIAHVARGNTTYSTRIIDTIDPNKLFI